MTLAQLLSQHRGYEVVVLCDANVQEEVNWEGNFDHSVHRGIAGGVE